MNIRGQEEYLTTSADVELICRSDVIDEDVHQSQFVAESDQRPQAARVQSDAVSVLSELAVQLLRTTNTNTKTINIIYTSGVNLLSENDTSVNDSLTSRNFIWTETD